MSWSDFKKGVSECEITDDGINRLQVAVLYGRILSKKDKIEVSRTLGALRAILVDARS